MHKYERIIYWSDADGKFIVEESSGSERPIGVCLEDF